VTLLDACGDPAGAVCRTVFEETGSLLLASAVDDVLLPAGRAVLIVAGAIVVYRLGRAAILRFTARYEEEVQRRLERRRELGLQDPQGRAETRRLQRLHAIGQAARSGLAILVGLTALLWSLAQFVNLGPVLAGAGLAGIVVGFGAQSLIADLLAGFSMLVEDQYGVGDWIEVDGHFGEVERVGLRTTSFRDLDGVVWHINNGAVNNVGNLTQRWARATLEIPLALETDIAHARRVVQDVADGLVADPAWGADIISTPEIWGVSHWGPDGMRLLLVIPTRPLRNWDVNRQLRERLKQRFELEGIRMPAPMLEVGGQVTAGRPLWTTDDARTPVTPPPGLEGQVAEPDGAVDHDTTGRIATEYGRVRPRQRPERER
jgi:small conductance mechanosensitive channel